MGLYLSQIIVTKITEQLVPLAMNRYQRWAESRGKEFKGREFSHAELELMLTPTDPDLFHVTIMTSNVVEFGYVTLFVFAFPLAPLLSWFNGILSLRSTCHVLMSLSPRGSSFDESRRRGGGDADRPTGRGDADSPRETSRGATAAAT